jgi:prepilin-type N-terminal cleavage/methylation domain-containing protein
MKRTHHKAFTLQELLVVMIITGIIFLAVMDGFRLFGKYAQMAGNRMNEEIDIYNNYSRLERLTEQCDTVYSISDSLVIIEKFDSLSLLTLQPASFITITERNLTDTLFSQVLSINIKRDKEQLNTTDTIIISVKNKKRDDYIDMKYVKDYSKKRSKYD